MVLIEVLRIRPSLASETETLRMRFITEKERLTVEVAGLQTT